MATPTRSIATLFSHLTYPTPSKRTFHSVQPPSASNPPVEEESPEEQPQKKKKAPNRPYADPSVYGHLNVVEDYISLGNDVLFCGINPGLSSAQAGHHYRGPTNRFWPCLSQSGLVNEPLTYVDDSRLPTDFNIGITNLVNRPTASASELSHQKDMRAHVPHLLHKILQFKPKVVCFVGKEIWREFEFMLRAAEAEKGKKTKDGKGKKEVGWELTPREWKVSHQTGGHTFFWVVSSTSGLVRDSMETRLKSWHALFQFVQTLKEGVFPILPSSITQGEENTKGIKVYKVVDVEGVEDEVEKMWKRLEAKTKNATID